MKKITTSIFALVLVVALCGVFVACNNDGNNNLDNDNKILFGTYPQTLVEDASTNSILNSLAGVLPTANNNGSWTSYEYYANGEIENYMWYMDLECGNEKYRGVYFVDYRPYYMNSSNSTDYSFQDNNGYTKNTVYWFRYEPIEWDIVDDNFNGTGGALILCDTIIDSREFYESMDARIQNDKTIYSNNYEYSAIRAWLNGSFYDTAFSFDQKNMIMSTVVDNSAQSTGNKENQYACENTTDKVFLPSYAEVTAYKNINFREARQKKITDYAQAQGCYPTTSGEYEGKAFWWLRSAHNTNSQRVRLVTTFGGVDYYDYAYFNCFGVVPALVIDLSKYA